ncbi:MAG: DUF58 domain-containing protein [Gammaproteobacteria bacterium]|nr:DUF58 domain-containing protein [Gammaproteobacteria bacterium]
MRFNTLLWLIQHRYRWWQQRFSTKPQPLLTSTELQDLYQHASSTLPTAREVRHPLLGERNSVFAGSGYEFTDNRLHSAGEDTRFINWRLYARSGQLYRKLFLEERRPSLWIILDRRSSMRFGTQVRLKVTQAARLAMLCLYRGLRQQLPSAAVLLEQQAHWFKPIRTLSAAYPLQQAIIAAAPPQPDTQEIPLAAVLHELHVQLKPGCLIFLISDFHDLDDSMVPVLLAMSRKHHLSAYHIVDPIELQAPAQGDFVLWDATTDTTQRLNCNTAPQRQRYTTTLRQYHSALESRLYQGGVQYQRWLSSSDALQTTLDTSHAQPTRNN